MAVLKRPVMNYQPQRGATILTSPSLKDLERQLNDWFARGYQVSGGVTCDTNRYLAVVTKQR